MPRPGYPLVTAVVGVALFAALLLLMIFVIRADVRGALAIAPLSFIAVGVAVLAHQRYALQVRERRRRAGRCVNCGYDLRGGGDRCPECGTYV